jgi:hypothetical protein
MPNISQESYLKHKIIVIIIIEILVF